jgi:uncharacterized protein (DUF305 family)
MKISLTSMLAFLLVAAPAAAQMNPSHGHAGHGTAATSSAAKPAASDEAYRQANEKMHREMSVPLTGDADRDFVQGMIPHHQGAVDMARIVLQYGKDPEIKKLAGEIIAAQEKEIALFKAWLAKSGK